MKYVVLHHGGCGVTRVHHRIDVDGVATRVLPETEHGTYAVSVEILIEGDAEQAPPAAAQMARLRELLLELTLRYPHVQVGGHRQMRGSNTRCPGQHFPLKELREWATGPMLAQRDAMLEDLIADAYGPTGPRGFHRQPPPG